MGGYEPVRHYVCDQGLHRGVDAELDEGCIGSEKRSCRKGGGIEPEFVIDLHGSRGQGEKESWRTSWNILSTEAGIPYSQLLELTQAAGLMGLFLSSLQNDGKIVNSDADDLQDFILRDVYVFDQLTAHALNSLPPPQSTGVPRVHVFLPLPNERAPVTKRDWLALFLSLIKLVEVYILWALQAPILGLVSAMPWFYFFLAGTIINHHISGQTRKEFRRGRMDILAGQLPTTIKAGGTHQILLGVPQAYRQGSRWKVTWTLGSVICIAALVLCYLAVRRSQSVAPFWLAFQGLWLLLRTAYFYFAKELDAQFHMISASEEWKSLTYDLKTRVRLLAVGLSWSLKHSHPRGSYTYTGDLLSLREIQRVLPVSPDDLHHHFPLDATISTNTSLELSLVGAIGDTTLTAVAWLGGSPLSGMDLYDCCLLFIAWQGDQILRIPAMRVLASLTPYVNPQSDEEKRMELLAIPKGSPNWGMEDVKWVYWVPCEDGRWLQFESFDAIIEGKRKGRVMTSDQLAANLAEKTLGISLTKMEQVEQTVVISKGASKLLVEFMSV